VLKTSGSAFEKFYRDELTTLPGMYSLRVTSKLRSTFADPIPEVADRIFSTSVTATYTVNLPPNLPLSVDNLEAITKELKFPEIQDTVRTDILEVFAEDESASVQATLYNTLQKVLRDCPAIKEGSMSLPNKHYM
jgi:urate oxidase